MFDISMVEANLRRVTTEGILEFEEALRKVDFGVYINIFMVADLLAMVERELQRRQL